MRYVFLMWICCTLLTSCQSCNRSRSAVGTDVRTETLKSLQREVQIEIVSPESNAIFRQGDAVALEVKALDAAKSIDSLQWSVDGRRLVTVSGESATWNTEMAATGTRRIEAVAYYSSGERDVISCRVVLLAAREPKQYSYRVLRTYPHDRRAYTQGLLFDGGFLYESTGLKGESSLRRVNLQTGEPSLAVNLPPDVFGEGLALAEGDKLVQLTWTERVAFVYHKSDFRLLKRMSYNYREGWGLTYDGEHLLMTDGSAMVYFLDCETLTEIHRIEVCDYDGPVARLNELEYVNGELWANVYYTDDVLRIDPKTGAVTGRVNLAGLLGRSDRDASTNVLNGIAYDEETGKIYVTGKNWPKLFEIEIL